MGLLASGASWLARVQAESEGVPLTYTTLDGVAHAIRGTPFDVAAVTEQPNAPARFSFTERGYLILRSALAAIGVSEPEEGHLITEVIEGVVTTFVVSNRDTEPCWQWGEAQRLRFKVFTKVL